MDTPDALSSASNGMRVQAAELDVIAANLAHASTIGYRPGTQAVSSFGDDVRSRLAATVRQGPLRSTGVPTDLALVGPGFFTIATPDGVRYTRDGRFTPDSREHLRDAFGNPVLGSLGPVRFPEGARILEDGRVLAKGQVIDRLRVVSFDSSPEATLSNAYAAPPGAVPKRSFASVRCGYLEESGVDAIAEMTALIQTERSFEANQKAFEQTDESLRKLVTEVPAVRQ